MRFIEELRPLKLYKAGVKIYAPIDTDNKKKGSAILLLGAKMEDTYAMMNLPYMYNPNYFVSYYMSRDVTAFINYDGTIEDEDESEPLQEALSYNEKNPKAYIVYDKSCTAYDQNRIGTVYTRKLIDDTVKNLKLNTDNLKKDITVVVYKDLNDLKKKLNLKDYDSFSDGDSINVITYSSYTKDMEKRNGSYEEYLKHELFFALIKSSNPKLPDVMISYICGYLSGQYLSVKSGDSRIEGSLVIKKIVEDKDISFLTKMIKTGDLVPFAYYSTNNLALDLSSRANTTVDSARKLISATKSKQESCKAPSLSSQDFKNDKIVLTEDYLRASTDTGEFITYLDSFHEADESSDSKYDAAFRRYLYKERIKNNQQLFSIYADVKQHNPWIAKTYRDLSMYKSFNTFIDFSYYNSLFLKNNMFKLEKGLNIYWEMLNRFLNSNEISKYYSKQTIMIPVNRYAWGTAPIDELMDWRRSINPISLILRFMRKNLDKLQREWGYRNILFVSDKGYFKINFSTLELKHLSRITRNLTVLMSGSEIMDEDDDDDIIEDIVDPDKDTKNVITAKVIENISSKTGISIDKVVATDTNLDVYAKSLNDVVPIDLTKDNMTLIERRPVMIPTTSEQDGIHIFILGKSDKAVVNFIKDNKTKNMTKLVL